jgi:hypothetical protein
MKEQLRPEIIKSVRRFIRYTATWQWDGWTNARSDRVVLEFFVSFFSRKKKRIKTTMNSIEEIKCTHNLNTLF